MSRLISAPLSIVLAAGAASAQPADAPPPLPPEEPANTSGAPNEPAATAPTASTAPTGSAPTAPTPGATATTSTAPATSSMSSTGTSTAPATTATWTTEPGPSAVADATSTGPAPPDLSDQGIGASLGIAAGGRVTPGGLRVSGHYLYQLTEQDWFDGTASFTFGSGAPGCFRDRMDDVVCDHGLVDGTGVEVAANVRRFLGGRGEFWPYVRVGIGVALVRFADDEVTGVAVPLHGGGGVRVSVSDGIAVMAEAVLDLGFGLFGRGLGAEPQFGGSVTAGAEFRL